MRLSTLERIMLAAFLVASATVACGEDKPLQSIRLPISKQPVVPVAVTTLTAEELFVVESDVPCLVLASRVGFVGIETDTGPMKIKAIFSGGSGKSETRKFDAKYLWLIEAATAGEVEILVVPLNATDETVVIRRTLIISGVPPPDPDPKPYPHPDPEPKPPPPPVADRVLGLIVFSDLATRSPESAVLLTSRYWQTLSDRHRVAVYLRSTNERVGKAFAAEIGNMTGDVLLIRDDAKSAKLEAIPLPKNQAAFEASLKAWTSR